MRVILLLLILLLLSLATAILIDVAIALIIAAVRLACSSLIIFCIPLLYGRSNSNEQILIKRVLFEDGFSEFQAVGICVVRSDIKRLQRWPLNYFNIGSAVLITSEL